MAKFTIPAGTVIHLAGVPGVLDSAASVEVDRLNHEKMQTKVASVGGAVPASEAGSAGLQKDEVLGALSGLAKTVEGLVSSVAQGRAETADLAAKVAAGEADKAEAKAGKGKKSE